MQTSERSKLCAGITFKTETITQSPSSAWFLAPCPIIVSSHLIVSTSRYNKLCGSIRSFAHRVSLLPPQDPFRHKMEAQILAKLYDMGILNSTAKLSDIENKLTVSAVCRRRLAVVMCMSKMAETVSAVRFCVYAIHESRVLMFFTSGCQIYRTGPCTRGPGYYY